MAKYKVAQEWNVSVPARGIKAKRADILVNADSREAVTAILVKASHDLIGDNDALTLYAYLEDIARQWGGWVARSEYLATGAPMVYFDNNPILREALYYEAKK